MLDQLLVNGIVAGSGYALVALGFSLIYGTTRFFHFAHGAVFTCGAYLAWALREYCGLPLWLAIVLGMSLATLLGVFIELAVYRPLRRRYAGTLVLLVSSLGVYIVLQNTVSLVFGDQTRVLREQTAVTYISVLSALITPAQLIIVCTGASLLTIMTVVITRTRMGRAVRAVASDRELACAAGIDADRVVLFAFGVGSALAATAAVVISLDVDMAPTMGMNALLMGVIAMIIGGVGSVPGAAVGGLLLGLVQNLSIWGIGSQWQDAIAFAVLLVFLLFRPYGILGLKLRKAEI